MNGEDVKKINLPRGCTRRNVESSRSQNKTLQLITSKQCLPSSDCDSKSKSQTRKKKKKLLTPDQRRHFALQFRFTRLRASPQQASSPWEQQYPRGRSPKDIPVLVCPPAVCLRHPKSGALTVLLCLQNSQSLPLTSTPCGNTRGFLGSGTRL